MEIVKCELNHKIRINVTIILVGNSRFNRGRIDGITPFWDRSFSDNTHKRRKKCAINLIKYNVFAVHDSAKNFWRLMLLSGY
jgi:hypothetical protein